MRAMTLNLAFSFLALGVLSSASLAANPGSRSWINQRVNFWERVCLRPVLTGSSFKAAATKAGFRPNSGGTFIFKQTEIVASMQGSGRKCSCKLTFGTYNPNKAAQAVIKRTVTVAGPRITPDDDPQSIGFIKVGIQRAQVQVFKFNNDGLNWIGATITGRAACAAKS
ncbi:hypothetical protein IWQ48_001170 [Labrenzia sp. EL_13]|nr:hypothetical protein [Labrenzia sp. EL_13]